MLREVAEKRLSAIREFTDLGSGVKIAMRDLEIRGAGNLLGEEQHGHMDAVGYDLYCKMLSEAVRHLKGEIPEETYATTVDLNIDAYIPASYITNEYQKLDIYKRIAAIETEEEQEDMLEELIDRFGDPPRKVQQLIKLGEPHPICIMDDHGIGIGNVKTGLDDRRRYQNINFSIDEIVHNIF